MSGKPGVLKKAWESWELDALKTAWAEGGLAAAQRALPHRTRDSIRGKTCALNLRVHGREPYRKQPASEWIDAAIRRAYRSPFPCLKQLSRELDRTIGWLKWRAGVLGVRKAAAPYNRQWTDVEDDIIRDGLEAGHSVSVLHRHLGQAGFRRSLSAVADHVCRLQIGWNRNWYTAAEVGQLLGIESKAVVKWIDKGWLTAKRGVGISSTLNANTLDERHLRFQITIPALRKFMLTYPRAWDHRRVRIEVLLDLLCGDDHGLSHGTFGEAGHA